MGRPEPGAALGVAQALSNWRELYCQSGYQISAKGWISSSKVQAAIPLSGQVAGRIDAIKSAKEVVEETMTDFHEIMRRLAGQYVS